jgi:hypothetical protein
VSRRFGDEHDRRQRCAVARTEERRHADHQQQVAVGHPQRAAGEAAGEGPQHDQRDDKASGSAPAQGRQHRADPQHQEREHQPLGEVGIGGPADHVVAGTQRQRRIRSRLGHVGEQGEGRTGREDPQPDGDIGDPPIP